MNLKDLYTKDKPGVTKETETLRKLCKSNDWCKIENRIISMNDEHVGAITQMVILGIDPIKVVDNFDILVEMTQQTKNTIMSVSIIVAFALNNFK